MAPDRRRLRATFDTVAERYDAARPRYPAELFDRLVEATGVGPGASVLEVGSGTGIATRPLAERGLRVTALELGPALAAVARRTLADLADVTVVQADFERWAPAGGTRFDLVASATAWHWIDPAVRYVRAHEALRPGGHLATWSATHVFPEGGDPFFGEIQEVYDEIGERLPDGAPQPRRGELADDREEIEASGRFDVVAVHHLDWEVTYDVDGYLALLDTFSGHLAMAAQDREHLHAEIRRRLGSRPDGRLRRGWGAVLHVARRR